MRSTSTTRVFGAIAQKTETTRQAFIVPGTLCD
jgi:hypothetical protein